MKRIKKTKLPNQKINSDNSVHSVKKSARLVPLLLDWFAANARDLPWRRTRDPYAVWVSEIMLQQTQVKTVIPFWERWMRELPTIQAAAAAAPAKIHKLWEGLGYYVRVRNLQKAAQIIVAKHDGGFPEKFEDVLALPGVGRYTAGAICSIAFNHPAPVLDGNVIRVLTRVFGIAGNPGEKETNAKLWKIAEALVFHAKTEGRKEKGSALRAFAPLREENSRTRTKDEEDCCSRLNQSLMELGALVCAPRNPQCRVCPVKKLCAAFRENRVDELPSLGKRTATVAKRFVAFVVGKHRRFLVRQRPGGVVNAHLWEFPNREASGGETGVREIFKSEFGIEPSKLSPLCTVKHSITRHRITLEAFAVSLKHFPSNIAGAWKTPAQMRKLAFAAAHQKILRVRLPLEFSA